MVDVQYARSGPASQSAATARHLLMMGSLCACGPVPCLVIADVVVARLTFSAKHLGSTADSYDRDDVAAAEVSSQSFGAASSDAMVRPCILHCLHVTALSLGSCEQRL